MGHEWTIDERMSGAKDMIYQILYTRGTIKNNVSKIIYFHIKKTYSNSNVEEDEKQKRLKSRDWLENQHNNSGEK